MTDDDGSMPWVPVVAVVMGIIIGAVLMFLWLY